MDLTVHGRGGRVPGRGPGVAGGERPRRAAPELRHRRGLRAPPRVGAHAVRRPLVGGVVARGVRRPRRRLHPLADLRRGVLPRRRARAGEPERHLPPRSHDHGGRHRRAEGALPADDGVERDRVGAGLERAQRRLRPRRDPLHRRCSATTAPSGCSTARRSGRRARSGPTGASASSAPIPRPSATAASPSCSCRSTRPASPSARSRSSTATPASPRSSSTTCTCRSRTPSARCTRGGGWRWPPPGSSAASACAARRASAPRPTASSRCGGSTPIPSDTALRDAVADAWMQAEGYKLHTYMTVTQMIEGGTIGAEASLNKIFWSEMDVRIHELALDIARAGGRADGRVVRAVGRRVPVLAVGPDLRGHQRDPAQHHRRPRPRAPAEVPDALRVHRRPEARSPRACAISSPRSARPRRCARAWDDGAGHDSALWDHLGRDGRVRDAGPRSRRRPRRRPRSTSCCCSRSWVGPRCPGPIFETAAVVAPALGDRPPTRRYGRARRLALRAARARRRRGARARGRRPHRIEHAHRGRRHRRRASALHRRRSGRARSRTTTALAFDRGALAAAAYLVGSERAHDRRRRRVRARSASSTAGRSACTRR